MGHKMRSNLAVCLKKLNLVPPIGLEFHFWKMQAKVQRGASQYRVKQRRVKHDLNIENHRMII